MKKFTFIYYGGNKPEDMNPDDMPKVMAAWEKWYKELGDKLVDGGNPFASGSKKIDTPDNVSDIAEDEWPAKGYTIVNANDIDEAVEMAKGNPMLNDGSEGVQVRVYECMPM